MTEFYQQPLQPHNIQRAVIALHCSGGTGRQWRALAKAFAPRLVITPDLYGTRSRGHWSGSGRFRLVHEAGPILDASFPDNGRVHLVGHSYGGALALHIARRMPQRVASLTLYEPTAFHLLTDETEAEALRGLQAIGTSAGALSIETDSVGSVEHPSDRAHEFVEFWSGRGAWLHMTEQARDDVVTYIPKGNAEMDALMAEPTDMSAYSLVTCPVLLLHGSNLNNPARLAIPRLSRLLPHSQVTEVVGAGHMGPLTHPEEVVSAIQQHVAHAETEQRS